MQTINIAFCCDDIYAQHVCVALTSALENLSRESRARIFIVCSTFSIDARNYIISTARNYHADVQFIVVDKKNFAGLKISHYISSAAYFRIALPDLLPEDVLKILYLDCDLVVKDDLLKLYAADISDCPLAAVPEADPTIPRHILGIPEDAVYFNSGIMLINLRKWREEGLSQKLFDFIRQNPDRLRFWDQDALNIFFHDSFMPLHYRWNFTIQHIIKPDIYNSQDIGIIHFAGEYTCKPWFCECMNPLRGEYFHYLSMTPWRKSKPVRQKKLSYILLCIKSVIKRIFAEAVNCFKLITLLTGGVKTVASSHLPNKKGLALGFVKYFLKNNLIKFGLLGVPKSEQLLSYRVNIIDYNDFFGFFYEFFVQNNYRFSTSAPDPLIIYFGGNMGVGALYFKNLYPDSKIIVIEKDTKEFALLQATIGYNNLKGISVYNNAACAPEEDKAGSALPLSNINGAVDLVRLAVPCNDQSIVEYLADSGKIKNIKRFAVSVYHEGAWQEQLKTIREIFAKNNFSCRIVDDAVKNIGKLKTPQTVVLARNTLKDFADG